MRSQAGQWVHTLVQRYGEAEARRQVDAFVDGLENIEAAALAYDWSVWARPKQVPPPGDWRTFGHLGGRGSGKTVANSNLLNTEVQAGRCRLLLLLAQDESAALEIQVHGPSGLIQTAPPWCKPVFEASRLELSWPNGARAYVKTPESPRKIRGLEYDYAWLSELSAWPVATLDESYSNALLSTRVGLARVVWDATPKRRSPALLDRLRLEREYPDLHYISRATTFENPHLAASYIDNVRAAYDGTSKGREELYGEMLDESDSALVRQSWIDAARRSAPHRYARTVVGIDPAVTKRGGSDRTGIVIAGLGHDGQAYVISDRSGRHSPSEWATIVLDAYQREACSVVVVETNKAGDLVTQNLRAAARERGLDVIVLTKDERAPEHRRGVAFVREVYARGSKEDRAQPVAVAYERGRISHVLGAQLGELEDTLTTWEPAPGARSPDALDALTHAVTELLALTSNARPGAASADIRGAAAIARQLTQQTHPLMPIGRLGGGPLERTRGI